METITATYRWTVEEAQKAARQSQFAINRRERVFGFCLLFLLAFTFYELTTRGFSFNRLYGVAFMASISLYWFLIRFKVKDWAIRRGFEEQPAANCVINWEFSKENVKPESEKGWFPALRYSHRVLFMAACQDTVLAWGAFAKVVESPDGFLFYIQQDLLSWIPFSAFAQSDHIEKVREFAKTAGVFKRE